MILKKIQSRSYKLKSWRGRVPGCFKVTSKFQTTVKDGSKRKSQEHFCLGEDNESLEPCRQGMYKTHTRHHPFLLHVIWSRSFGAGFIQEKTVKNLASSSWKKGCQKGELSFHTHPSKLNAKNSARLFFFPLPPLSFLLRLSSTQRTKFEATMYSFLAQEQQENTGKVETKVFYFNLPSVTMSWIIWPYLEMGKDV